MASNTAELVKERLDIAEVVKGYIPLTLAGKNWKGLCPFHKEKTASFIVSPDRGTWHCFGCSKGGDLISFVMEYEHLEFIEALKILAEKAGVDFKVSGGRDEKQYALLYDIQSAAMRFYEAALAAETPQAKVAREYLVSRGLTKKTIQEFGIGFAPLQSDVLSRTLLKAGYSIDDVVRAGLILKTERGTYWDRFRNRIMFPLHNAFGKVVGFTGRIMPGGEGEGVGKYVNSPETPIFQKSKVLFGFDKTKSAIRESRTAVLVEGQMDFLMVWQDGVKNAIATSGTALTQDHLRLLRRVADTLILGFDTDAAGQLAIERTIELASGDDFTLSIFGTASEEKGYKDPAEMVQAHPGLIREVILNARPAMHYFFDRYLTETRGNMAAMKQNIRTVLLRLKAIASPLERAHWLKELGARTGMGEGVLLDEMSRLIREKKTSAEGSLTPQAPSLISQSRHELIAERLLILAVRGGEWYTRLHEHPEYLPEPHAAMLMKILGKPLRPLTQDEEEAVALFEMRAGLLPNDPQLLKEEYESLLKELTAEHFRLKRDEIAFRIRTAERKGDEAALQAALQEFDTISRSLKRE